MKALTWHGKGDIRCESVPDPKIEHPRDAIIKVTACAICGSDLHLYDGVIPTMQRGDVLGHETMGEVVEVGAENTQAEDRRPRRRAVHHRLRRMLLLPARLLLRLRALQPQQPRWRRSCGAIRRPGCSATRTCSAAIAGGQAEYLRVPFADVGPIKVPDGLTRRAGAVPVGHLPDRLHGAPISATSSPATPIAIWGCGPVGAVRDPQRVPARRGAGDRDRHGAGAPGDGARGRRASRSISRRRMSTTASRN